MNIDNMDKNQFIQEVYKLSSINKQLVEALKEIVKCEGAYSQNQLEHAKNTIENLVNIAQQALKSAEGE